MITIEIDGKKYVPNGEFYFYESIYDWIKLGDLVELQPQEEKTKEKKLKITAKADIEEYFKSINLNKSEQSILQKLRAELERRRDEYDQLDDTPNPYNVNSKMIFTQVISLLNELE